MGLSVARGEGDGAGRCDVGPALLGGREETLVVPGTAHAGLASGVGELDSSVRAVGVEEIDDAGERGDVLVLPEAEVVGGDAALGENRGGFGEDQAGASDG